jgi:hypothetical protein
LQQRGLAVVTSSGTLVTLLFAIGAVAIEATDFTLPELSKVLFAGALAAFAIAGIFGILANRPDYYEEVDTAWLRKTMSPVAWNYNNLALAKRRTSEARVRASTRSAKRISRKSNYLREPSGPRLLPLDSSRLGSESFCSHSHQRLARHIKLAPWLMNQAKKFRPRLNRLIPATPSCKP